MKYYTRKGIVMTSVGEQQVLVSAVSLHDQVPYVTNINDTTATLWEKMVHGATKDELIACIMEEYEVENEPAVREDIDRVLRQLSEQNYITFE